MTFVSYLTGKDSKPEVSPALAALGASLAGQLAERQAARWRSTARKLTAAERAAVRREDAKKGGFRGSRGQLPPEALPAEVLPPELSTLRTVVDREALKDAWILELSGCRVRGHWLGYGGGEQVGGGRRGAIEGLSYPARKRMLGALMSVDWGAIPREELFVVGLTYPEDFVVRWDGEPYRVADGRRGDHAFLGPSACQGWEVKRHWDTLLKRLRRRFPGGGVFWKLEFQGRGAPHFHCIFRLSEGFASERAEGCQWNRVYELREWLARAWWEIVGSGSELHLQRGSVVEPIRSGKGTAVYVALYVGANLGGRSGPRDVGGAGGESNGVDCRPTGRVDKGYQHQWPRWFGNPGRWWGWAGEAAFTGARRTWRAVDRAAYFRVYRVARRLWRAAGKDYRIPWHAFDWFGMPRSVLGAALRERELGAPGYATVARYWEARETGAESFEEWLQGEKAAGVDIGDRPGGLERALARKDDGFGDERPTDEPPRRRRGREAGPAGRSWPEIPVVGWGPAELRSGREGCWVGRWLLGSNPGSLWGVDTRNLGRLGFKREAGP